MSSPDHAKRSTAEWISLLVALAILAAVIGLVVWVWVCEAGSPAQFTVERGETRQANAQFYLLVTIHNDGDLTASEVLLEATLDVDGQEETASTTFDFVPGHSEREATLMFSADPAEAELQVMSYQEP